MRAASSRAPEVSEKFETILRVSDEILEYVRDDEYRWDGINRDMLSKSVRCIKKLAEHTLHECFRVGT